MVNWKCEENRREYQLLETQTKTEIPHPFPAHVLLGILSSQDHCCEIPRQKNADTLYLYLINFTLFYSAHSNVETYTIERGGRKKYKW